MNEQRLESMVTHLVQCTCNGAIDCPKDNDKGLTRLDDLPFRQPITNLCNEESQGKTSSMAWNSILKDFLARCPQFCRDELVNIPRPFINARWRETSDRKVLAPLALKENTDNIIAGSLDMSRKRKSDVDTLWTPPKRLKLLDTLKPCSVVIRKASVKSLLLQFRCVNNKAFVKLYDILKELPQEKQEEKVFTQNEYMGFLGLDSKQPADQKQRPELKTSHPIKLVSHPNIPFSSDYGRRLLARERHCLPQEVALRKIERTEWYLKGAATVGRNNHGPEVTFDRRTKYIHSYKFPKRQFYQHHESLQQAFVRYVCKPAVIKLERTDLTSFLRKNQVEPQELVQEPKENPNMEVDDLTIDSYDDDDDDDDDVVSVASTMLSCATIYSSSTVSSRVTSDYKFSDTVSETSSEYNFSVVPKTVKVKKEKPFKANGVATKREQFKFKKSPPIMDPNILQLRRSRRLNHIKEISK